LTSYTDANNKVTSYGYNTSNDLTKITTPAGTVTDLTYDTQHRVKTIIYEIGTTSTLWPETTFSYSPGSSTSPSSGTTTVVDPDGNAVTNPNGNTTTYTYNAFDEIIKTTDSYTHAVTTGWDADGQGSSFADNAGNTTTLGYSADGLNNLDSVLAPAEASGNTVGSVPARDGHRPARQLHRVQLRHGRQRRRHHPGGGRDGQRGVTDLQCPVAVLGVGESRLLRRLGRRRVRRIYRRDRAAVHRDQPERRGHHLRL
jgi:YD repeat-containing protein